MPLPTNPPTTSDDVEAWSRITGVTPDSAEAGVLDDLVDAVNELVAALPIAEDVEADPAPEDWPATIKLGAKLLAARLWRRRNTPGGVEAAGDFGIAYVRRNDPDIAQMLGLGEYDRPRVG